MKNEKLTEEYVKDFYNTELKAMGEKYTDRRWFSSKESAFDYEQTKFALLHALGGATHQHGLEVGPGDGVWTKYIALRVAALDLLDQSEEMLRRAKEELRDLHNITYTQGNFAEVELGKNKYDLITSVRCFEYITDKERAIQKLYAALQPGGTFVLITKNPHYRTMKNWKRPLLHTEQMGREELVRLMQKHGFIVNAVYPAVYRWKSSYALFRGIFTLLQKLTVLTNGKVFIPWLTDRATESYVFVARKEKVTVELYGLSGAGKSTLAETMAQKDPLVKIMRPTRRGIGVIYFAHRNPALFFSWIFEMFRFALLHGRWNFFRHRLAVLLSTFESVGRAQKERGGIVVLDEGLFQRIFSIHEKENTVEELKALIKYMPLPNLLVVVDRKNGTFRWQKEGSLHPRAGQSEEERTLWSSMIQQNHKHLMQVLQDLHVPTHFFTNGEQVDELLLAVRSL